MTGSNPIWVSWDGGLVEAVRADYSIDSQSFLGVVGRRDLQMLDPVC